MGGVSKQQELQRISLELHKLTLQKEQLNNRLHLLAMMKEFRENVAYHKEVNDPTEKDEYEKIEEELNKLLEKKLSLQALQEKLEATSSDDAFSTVQKYDPLSNEIFIVEKPPPYPVRTSSKSRSLDLQTGSFGVFC